MRLRTTLLTLVATTLAFVGAVSFLWNDAAWAQHTKPLRHVTIGILTELSGPFAANGADVKAGFDAAMFAFTKDGKIHGYQVELIYGDSKGDGATAVTEFTRMTSADNLVAVVLNRSQVCMPVNSISRRTRIPMLCAAGHPDLVSQNPYAFRFWPTSISEGHALAAWAISSNNRRVAIISAEDEYMLSLGESFKESLNSLGGQISYDTSVVGTTTDFSAVVARVKTSIPDAIFVNVGITQIGPLVRKLREQELRNQLIGNLWLQKGEVITTAGISAVEGGIFIGMDLNHPNFAKALLDSGDAGEPNNIKYAAFTALATALQALASSDSISDKTSMHSVLQSMKTVPLLDEPLTMVNREAQYQLRYYKITDGKAVPFAKSQVK